MELESKCFPVGALPYQEEAQITRMMVRLFEKMPYLPFLPKIPESCDILHRTFDNIEGIAIEDDKILMHDVSGFFISMIDKLDEISGNPDTQALESFNFNTFYMDKYLQIVERIKPKHTVINLLGPFTMAQLIKSAGIFPLADKLYRKFIIQTLTIKSLWIINKIKQYSKNTTPIIMLEEPKLNEFGVIRKKNESITRELIVNLYSKIFQGIRSAGALAGIQSFNKCDWQIPIDAGVDIISIDAYNNYGNLTIIAPKIRELLERGGYINLGLVPVQSESIIKNLSIEKLYDKFISVTGAIITSGVDRKLLYNNVSVSIQGNVSKYPIIFAEKALILASKLASRIPNP